ncbi:MAG TPA: zf-HC2 domain-containing protein, partial [Myxococcaceae bacterium]|nr:zf-HC2 domain-containing protein [Myxococcaceae bacterium]
MNCEKLHPFADGELDPSEHAAFLEHLRGCEACQSGLDDLIQLQLLEQEAARRPQTGADRPPEPSADRPPGASAPLPLRPRWRTRIAAAAAMAA